MSFASGAAAWARAAASSRPIGLWPLIGSTLIAFEVAGGKQGAFRFQDALRLVRISNNLGDAKSLITHPATTTHQRLTPEVRAELGIFDNSLRLSIGLEDMEDLKTDLDQALAAARQ